MARLMMQRRGEKPTLLCEGARADVRAYSHDLLLHNTRKSDKRRSAVRGSATEWALINLKANRVASLVWIEPSSKALAEAPIPDWCRAPAGAPA